MGILYTGEKGTALKDIIEQLNIQSFPTIMVRCLWDYNGAKQDDLIGYCKYENGALEPLDGDSYSLDDKFIKWQHYDEEGCVNLCVWERGYFSEEVKELERGQCLLNSDKNGFG